MPTKRMKKMYLQPEIAERQYVVGIDPGFGGTGLALFKNKTLQNVLWIRDIRKKSFVERAHSLASDIDSWVFKEINKIKGSNDFTERPAIVCEIPAYQNTPSRSMGWKKGDLQKLTYFVGAIGYACSTSCYNDKLHTYPEFITVSPAGWKGQLSKQIVIDRIKRKYSDVEKRFQPKLDIWDAIGIGLWAIEEF